VSSARTGRWLWWVSPHGALLLVVPTSLLLAAATSDLDFRLLYRTPKSLTAGQSLLFLCAGGMLLLGVLITQALRGRSRQAVWPALRPSDVALLHRASGVVFVLTCVGYASMLLAGFARGVRPADLVGALTAQSNYSGALRAGFAPVTGLTTLTQLGIAYVVLGGLLLLAGERGRVPRRLAVVLLLGLFRAFFLTERLAVLELVLPLVALAAVHARRRGGRRALLDLAPVAALPLLAVVFGAFEYSRSWVFFRSRTTATFPEFVLDRLAGYYATAYNNGAIGLEHAGHPGRLPYSSIEAFWTAPGVEQLGLYQRLTGVDPTVAYTTMLAQYGSPEFNNPGGLSLPLVDFGVPGGLVAFLLLGLLIGLLWTWFQDGAPYGLLLYPVAFTGLLELPRYLYVTQGRLVPPVFALLVVAHLMRRPAPQPLTVPARPLVAA
jgi:hypothetical protein